MAEPQVPVRGFLSFAGVVVFCLFVFFMSIVAVVLSERQKQANTVVLSVSSRGPSSALRAALDRTNEEENKEEEEAESVGSNVRQPLSVLADRVADLVQGHAEEVGGSKEGELKSLKEQGIYYAHFSKSGGTTFKTVIKQYLASQNTTWCANKQPARQPRIPGPMEICGAHDKADSLLRTDQDQLSHKNLTTIILLRDPIERMLSEYAWFYRYKGHLGGIGDTSDPFFRFKDLSFSEKGKVAKVVMEDFLQQLSSGSSSTLCGYLAQLPGTQKPPECTEAEYDRALRMLASFDLVLLTEKFDESLVLLSRALRFPNSIAELGSNGSFHYVKRKVISKSMRKSDFPQPFVELLEQKLHYDYRLYALAKKMYEGAIEQTKEYDPNFERLVQIFTRHQATITEHCRQDETAKFPTCL